MQGVGTQPGPGHGNNGSSPCVCGGVHTCVAGVCSCTGDFARGCGCTWVCVHVGRAAGCVRAGCVHMAHACASSSVCAPCSAATAWGREAGGGWQCRVTPCCALSHRAVPCHAMSHRAMPSHAMPCQPSHNPVPAPLPSLCLAPPGKHQLGWFCPKAGVPMLAAPSTVFPPHCWVPPVGLPGGAAAAPQPRGSSPPLFTAISTFSRRRREAPHVPAVQ